MLNGEPSGIPGGEIRRVLLVHGLDDPGKVWMNLGPALLEAGYEVLEFRDPNDQPIRASAAFLGQSLANTDYAEVPEMAIVAHSMGGLVSREYLTSPEIGYGIGESRGPHPEVLALIMVGTPNHGSALARFRFFAEFRDQWQAFLSERGDFLGGILDGAGEAGIDLMPNSRFLLELNARPHPPQVKLVCIAGIASPVTRESVDEAVAGWSGSLPEKAESSVSQMGEILAGLADGVGDGVVPAASVRLEESAEHFTVGGNHLSMIRNVRSSSERIPPAVPIILEQLEGIWRTSGE
jgi:pimeloyl-ACP methyl ester carboxylesterase